MDRVGSILNSLFESTKVGKKEKPQDEGFPGTEIGLPIDRENCEGTDAGGVATPSGTINPRKKILTDGRTVICPKCKSVSVNIHDNGTTFYCVDCGHTWPVTDVDDDGVADDRDNIIDLDSLSDDDKEVVLDKDSKKTEDKKKGGKNDEK